MIESNDYLGIPEVAQLLGGKVSHHAIRRWVAVGVGSPAVRLPATRIGCRYFMRKQDVHEFIRALNEDPQTFARRKKSARVAKAKRKLQQAGA